MCIDCGCAERTAHSHDHKHDHDHDHGRTIRVEEDLLARNDRLAAGNRERFARHNLLVLNLVSSP
ncbi:MAG: hydrogenase nickel incorporation protein HypB, partial [Deltaproteobacteria bacterium]